MQHLDGVAIYESRVYDQSGGTCYAHAISDAIISNQIRWFRYKAINHHQCVKMMVDEFGSNGANTEKVLDWICPEILPLKWRLVDQAQSFTALDKGRAIIGSFYLNDKQWNNFHTYFKNYPDGPTSPQFLNMPTKGKSTAGGHAVLLVDYFKSPIESQSSYLVKNSWGPNFADNGMCRIEASLFRALYEVYSPHPLLDQD